MTVAPAESPFTLNDAPLESPRPELRAVDSLGPVSETLSEEQTKFDEIVVYLHGHGRGVVRPVVDKGKRNASLEFEPTPRGKHQAETKPKKKTIPPGLFQVIGGHGPVIKWVSLHREANGSSVLEEEANGVEFKVSVLDAPETFLGSAFDFTQRPLD